MHHKLKYLCTTLALILALNSSFERSAHAYVDPGSGLLAVQSMSAVVTGALFYFRARIKNLLRKARHPALPGKKN